MVHTLHSGVAVVYTDQPGQPSETVVMASLSTVSAQLGQSGQRNYHLPGKPGQLSTYLCSLQLVLDDKL